MTLLVCGDRNWTRRDVIERWIRDVVRPGELVIQGGNGYFINPAGREFACKSNAELSKAVRGADAFAYQTCKTLSLKCRTYWAEWELYGKSAGPKRNLRMIYRLQLNQKEALERNEIDEPRALAFHNDIEHSRGTANMLGQLKRAGIGYVVVRAEDISPK